MYDNIFQHLNKATLEDYENLFEQTTEENYKDFLNDQYIIKRKTKREIGVLLGATVGAIATHLRKYNIILERLEHENDLMNKTPSMIEKEYGLRFDIVYNELKEQGLSLTEITAKLNMKSVSTVSATLYQIKKRDEKALQKPNESKLIIKGLKGSRGRKTEEEFRKQLGIEYKDFLQQKYMDEGMNLEQISEITGISREALSDKLQYYGIYKSHSQRRKESIKSGTIDYDAINRKSRRTRMLNLSKSNKQDIFIGLIKHHLELAVLKFDNIEVVTGYNEYCVLNSLEIDIPIIVFYKDKVTKFAIEYDGEIWHKDKELDELKNIRLSEKNWIVIRIQELSGETTNMQILESHAKKLVNQIIELI